jgi:hypothetical protein
MGQESNRSHQSNVTAATEIFLASGSESSVHAAALRERDNRGRQSPSREPRRRQCLSELDGIVRRRPENGQWHARKPAFGAGCTPPIL